jgi:hypothetical protein
MHCGSLLLLAGALTIERRDSGEYTFAAANSVSVPAVRRLLDLSDSLSPKPLQDSRRGPMHRITEELRTSLSRRGSQGAAAALAAIEVALPGRNEDDGALVLLQCLASTVSRALGGDRTASSEPRR